MSPPPGVAEERTALAWQRTGLGVMAVAGLLGHRTVEAEQPVLLALAGLVALLALVVLGGLAPVRYRRVREGLAGSTFRAARRTAAGATAIVVVTALAALAAVLTPG